MFSPLILRIDLVFNNQNLFHSDLLRHFPYALFFYLADSIDNSNLEFLISSFFTPHILLTLFIDLWEFFYTFVSFSNKKIYLIKNFHWSRIVLNLYFMHAYTFCKIKKHYIFSLFFIYIYLYIICVFLANTFY